MTRYSKTFIVVSSLLALNACKLVDQRTFNPSAGRRPVPYVPPAPPAPPPPAPPIEIVQGTPGEQWAKPLTTLVKDALKRKPDAMFLVTIVTPISEAPATQQEAMQKTIQENGQDVAQAIIKAGARPEQILMSAKADGSVQKNVVQVNIK
ncbi:hypothetical protein CIN_20310 [Commensalibacter intestini A911]|uniref:Uncharacterized protein n=2 Tax=Commensalibacter intestini TaxID=479936 RepID=A0A251ZSQ9_9PROT|nr:hypothetical protein [Commensalibacter intestini]EHD13048.1 hypothetical protein CIN_20310 [Commensalibacter intestini A911]OUI77691.1 hypothetical protein HK18_03290 [Commensalibacter intestini]